jgi:hypothetical protein
MTDPEAKTTRSLDDLIDRLVDGTVPPAELRQAFRRLEASPDGWKRCATAFLEAQSWGEALRGEEHATAEPAWGIALAGGFSPRAPVPNVRSRAVWPLAAALVLAAFALGWTGRGLRGGAAATTQQPSQADLAATAARPDQQVATLDPPASPSREPSPEPRSRPAADRVPAPAIQEVARLRIDDGRAPAAEVPILAGTGLDARWLLEQPPAVSEHQRAVWERQGYRLEERRRLVPVSLGDGRLAAVPVDQVNVRYVGHDPL